MTPNEHDMIHRELFGGPPKVRATFSLSPELDPKATEATGYATQVAEITPGMTEIPTGGFRIYRDVVVIEERAEGERDYISVKATEAHKRQYPNEWKRFSDSQTKVWHDVRLSPGCTPAVVSTLEEMGIRTLEGLAAFDKPLPDFIEKHRAFARRFLSFLKPRFKIVDGQPVEVAA